MESYLVDETVLGEIVDAFLKEKYPDQPVSAHESIRKDAIKSLDHQILKAILGKLTKEQGSELGHLLDDEASTSDTFTKFFEKNDIDLQATIADAMVNFKNEFLRSKNA